MKRNLWLDVKAVWAYVLHHRRRKREAAERAKGRHR